MICTMLCSGDIVTAALLDHETEPFHTFMVRACDSGTVRQCDTTNIRINVADFNDEPPIFDQATYRTDVCYVAASPSTDLLQPVATDGDSGSNAELTYSLLTTTALFSLDTANGRISVSQTPTVDDIGTHTLTVQVRDGGENPLFGTAEAIIRIINCSDSAFYFREPFHYFEIEEGESSFLGRIATLRLDLSRTPQDVVFFPDTLTNPLTNTLNVRMH